MYLTGQSEKRYFLPNNWKKISRSIWKSSEFIRYLGRMILIGFPILQRFRVWGTSVSQWNGTAGYMLDSHLLKNKDHYVVFLSKVGPYFLREAHEHQSHYPLRAMRLTVQLSCGSVQSLWFHLAVDIQVLMLINRLPTMALTAYETPILASRWDHRDCAEPQNS